MSTNTLIVVGLVVVIAAVFLVRAILPPDFRGTVGSWTEYFRGPGMLQFIFLVIGGVGASASVRFAPSLRTFPVATVKDYHIDPRQGAIYHEDIRNYSHLTVLARTTESGGNARLTIFRSGLGNNPGESKQLEISSTLWARIDMENSSPSMSLFVEPSTPTDAAQTPQANKATQVDMTIYLTAK